MNRIFVIGHYGGDNFGDEVMLESILINLRNISRVDKISVVSKQPESHISKNSKAVFIPNSFRKIFLASLNSNILLLGGGTHFHDDYTKSRYRKHRIYLIKILLISMFIRAKGGKVVFVGVGYGPINRRETAFLSKISLFIANRVVVRDKESYDLLRKLSINSMDKVRLGGDISSLFKEIEGWASSKKQIKTVGISLTSFAYSNRDESDNFWEEIFSPAFIKNFRENNLTVKIFVFRGGLRESDLPLSKKLFELLAEVDSERVRLISFTYDIYSFVEELSTCGSFLATRYHSAVLSYLTGADLLIVPYHDKLISFREEIGLENSSLIKPSECNNLSEKLRQYQRPELKPSEYVSSNQIIYSQIFQEL